MRPFVIISVIILIAQPLLHGQGKTISFGDISQEEMDYSVHPQDKTAEAVVFYDMGKSYFVRSDNSFEVVFERTTRIKILSEAGVKWAEVEIPFYQEGGVYERVYSVKANTYNFEDGKLNITKLDAENIYTEKTNEYWNNAKFAIPDVKEGSIIEYTYKISSQHMFNLRDWEFQWKIPVLYSEYEVSMIPFYEYTYLLQGAKKFDYQDSYVDKGLSRQFGSVKFQDMIHRYVMKDIPAFYDEEYISSVNDYILKIDFQLSMIHYPNGTNVEVRTTWPKMIEDLSKHADFGKYLKKSQKLVEKNFNLDSLQTKSSKEKFNAILNYVKAKYNWDKYYGKYASKTPNDFVRDKYGNSAEINLFTLAMLNSVGIDAYPVIMSTRDHGKVRIDYPFSHFFNYVIILAILDDEEILTDATEVLSSNERLPVRCINDKGLIINEEKVEWVQLQGIIPSIEKVKIKLNPSEVGYKASVVMSFTEYTALKNRKYFGANTEKLIEELRDSEYSVIDSIVTIENFQEIDKPYILTFDIEGDVEYINDKIYISPFLNEIITDIPFKQKTRTYPVDMIYPQTKSYTAEINIPDGYEVDYLPENKIINNSLFELNYIVSTRNEKIITSFTYTFRKPQYTAEEYSRIKYYFREIVSLGNEKIVFHKKE